MIHGGLLACCEVRRSDARLRAGRSRYLDLETATDRARLTDPADHFDAQEGRLVILDEIQRVPELFAVLRGVVDRRRRRGERGL